MLVTRRFISCQNLEDFLHHQRRPVPGCRLPGGREAELPVENQRSLTEESKKLEEIFFFPLCTVYKQVTWIKSFNLHRYEWNYIGNTAVMPWQIWQWKFVDPRCVNWDLYCTCSITVSTGLRIYVTPHLAHCTLPAHPVVPPDVGVDAPDLPGRGLLHHLPHEGPTHSSPGNIFDIWNIFS